MKQIFVFLSIFSLCLTMVSCNKCSCTKGKKIIAEKKYTELTEKEKEFAAKLTTENKKIFCEDFTAKQRETTMRLLDINDSERTSGTCSGNIPEKMTPDKAVEMVYRGHRMHIKED